MVSKVLKFGGTSVGSPERVLEAIACVRDSAKESGIKGVVVSAFTQVTDQLQDLARLAALRDSRYEGELAKLEQRHHDAVDKLLPNDANTREFVKTMIAELEETLRSIFVLRECSPKTNDLVLGFGERLSAYIIARTMSILGTAAEFVDAREMIRTNDAYGCAEVDFEPTNVLIRERLSKVQGIPIITGFIGSTANGWSTTLGRGGSDYTAAIVAGALEVDEVEIWTDVDGIMTADPRLVPTAIPIESLTYEEAMELSHFGAKILYPPTVRPALEHGIQIRIRNTTNPTFPGSVIGDKSQTARLVTAISSIPKVALLRVQGSGMQGATGTARRVFGALANREINVILITQASSEHTICFAVQPESAANAVRVIEKEFEHEIARGLVDPIVAETSLSILSVVGEQMRHLPGISGRFFQALGTNGVNVAAIAQGSSELNISAVIGAEDRAKALCAVHDAFFLSDLRTAHLFVVGDGLVGSTLLRQIDRNRNALKQRYGLDLKVVGLVNTRQMALSNEGLFVAKVEEADEKLRQKADLEAFVETMSGMNLPHCVFVDCTASDRLPALYDRILDGNISIVTPNKRALSGNLQGYLKLKKVEQRRNVRFLYETCVGAGLPIIGTLIDLLKSGDEIYRVEAVLSGTLSFLFNTYSNNSESFAAVVKEAKEKGYTEPDPREDLSGADVGRKLLILAREIGWEIEPAGVGVENLVPPSCRGNMDVEDFYRCLENEEPIFRRRLHEASREGGKLCYIASIGKGRAETKLTVAGPDHPFHSLSGSDNIVSFTTRRYCNRPLVVRGPGAGSEVTAAGVFADILRVIET